MVEIGGGEYSRELCGGTHVRATAEIGPFHVLSETSSAANVRRIEAVTGPEAVKLLRQRDRLLRQVATTLRTTPEDVPQMVLTRESERRALEKASKGGAGGAGGVDVDALAAGVEEVAGTQVLATTVDVAGAAALLEVVDRLKGRFKGAAILLGTAADGRVHLVASVAPELVTRGIKAGAVVKQAAEIVGGGGGGRDTMAQAGGRHPEKLEEAIRTARATIVATLEG
jgi:alanyl-tRNA synthetase